MERLRPLLAVRVEAGMAQGEATLVGWDLLARERMDMGIEEVEEAREVEDLARLLELECQVVNGEEESEFLKDRRVEAGAIQEVIMEEAEGGIKSGLDIFHIRASCVTAFNRQLASN
jgi:hypothetical protein